MAIGGHLITLTLRKSSLDNLSNLEPGAGLSAILLMNAITHAKPVPTRAEYPTRYTGYERPLTFFDIVGSLFRYKWRFMFVTLLMLVISAVVIMLFPKKYESEAKLFVRLGRGSASLDPATMGQTISIQESRESEMNSIVDMLQSRGLAERIVASVGHERVLKKYAWAERTGEEWSDWASDLISEKLAAVEEDTPASNSMTPEEVKEQERFELAVKELGKQLRIDSPKKSTTISVTYRGRTPELSKDVVTAAIDAYQQMHIDAYQSGGALDFFDEQFNEQEQLVAATENLLRDAKNANSVVTMSGKQESLQSEITAVKQMQLSNEADLGAAIARVKKLRSDMNELPANMVSETTRGVAENATDAMRDRLYQLEIEEQALASKYVSTHPELTKIREQLRNARDIMDRQPKDRETSVMAVNPVRLQIENELLLAEASVASLEAKSQSLLTLEQGLIERLNGVNDLEVQAYEMQRKIDIARDNHRSYAMKLEETRINAALDKQALSNVSVVSQPTARLKHVSPKRSVLALLGGVFSLLCGVAVALLSDFGANARETKRIRDAERDRYLARLEAEKLALKSNVERVLIEDEMSGVEESSPNKAK